MADPVTDASPQTASTLTTGSPAPPATAPAWTNPWPPSAARAKGRLRGKQPKLSARQQAHLVQLHQSGQHTIAELAELFSVSRPTVYRVLERARGTSTSLSAGNAM